MAVGWPEHPRTPAIRPRPGHAPPASEACAGVEARRGWLMGVGPRRAGGGRGLERGGACCAGGRFQTDWQRGEGRHRPRTREIPGGGGSPALIMSGRGPYRVSGSSEGRNEMAWRQRDCSVCDGASHCSPARARPAAGGKPAQAGTLSLRARSARLRVRPERGRRAKPRMQEEL